MAGSDKDIRLRQENILSVLEKVAGDVNLTPRQKALRKLDYGIPYHCLSEKDQRYVQEQAEVYRYLFGSLRDLFE